MTSTAAARSRPAAAGPATAGLVLTALVLVLAFGVPHWFDWDVHARAPRSVVPHGVPPLHGYWSPQPFGPGTLPAVAIALLGWRYAAAVAARLPWRRLLLASYVV